MGAFLGLRIQECAVLLRGLYALKDIYRTLPLKGRHLVTPPRNAAAADVFQLTNKSPAYPRVLLPGLHQAKYLRADSAQNSTCLYPNKQVALPETLLPFTSQRAGPPMRNFAPALGKTWLQNNFTTG